MDSFFASIPCNAQQRTVCVPSFTLWSGFECVLQDQFPFQNVKEEQNNSISIPDHDTLVQADKESILALTDNEEEANNWNHPPTVF